MGLINFNLVKHWENWATILLMVAIAFFAINSIGKLISTERQ